MKIGSFKSAKLFQSGQVAVSILLIMSVLVVVSFSLAQRTTNEVSLSTQTAESTAVFNAAETGVNEALAAIYQKLEADQAVPETVVTETKDLDGDGVDDVDITYESRSSNEITTRLMEGMTMVIKLEANSPDIKFEWAREDDCADRASLLISVYSDDSGTTRARYYPVGCDRGNGDQFEVPTESGGNFKDGYILSVETDPTDSVPDDLFVRVKAVYNDTNIRVVGSGGDLSPQAFIAESRATNKLGDKQETRALEVVRSHATAPSILDYAVYTEGNLIK